MSIVNLQPSFNQVATQNRKLKGVWTVESFPRICRFNFGKLDFAKTKKSHKVLPVVDVIGIEALELDQLIQESNTILVPTSYYKATDVYNPSSGLMVFIVNYSGMIIATNGDWYLTELGSKTPEFECISRELVYEAIAKCDLEKIKFGGYDQQIQNNKILQQQLAIKMAAELQAEMDAEFIKSCSALVSQYQTPQYQTPKSRLVLPPQYQTRRAP